jgi:hypothetical protein
MKKIILFSLIFSTLIGSFFTATYKTLAYSLPDNGIYFGCLWQDASCTTNSVRETPPTVTELPRFYLDVVEACLATGNNGGVCSLQASKAVAAAETYSVCITDNPGNAADCATAANFSANQITTAKPAPANPATQTATPTVEPKISLCDQLSGADIQTCKNKSAVCAQNDTECQKTAVVATILTKVTTECIASGLTTEECYKQFDLAKNTFLNCLDSDPSVSTCLTNTEEVINFGIACPVGTTAGGWLTSPLRYPCKNGQGTYVARTIFTCPTGTVPVTTGSRECRAGNTSVSPVGESSFVRNQPNGNGNLGYVPLEPILGINSSAFLQALYEGKNVFGDLLNILLQVVISLGALIAVGALVYGGVAYMISGVSETHSEAKHRIEAAFWGLLILLASWLILNTINPQLLQITNIFRATPNTPTTNTNTGTNNSPAAQTPQTATQLQTQINECAAKSTPTENCALEPDPVSGQSFCSC